MSSSKGKILVTGATGYIGSHMVVELHKQGYEAILVDNFTTSFPVVLEWIESIIGKEPVFYKVDCSDYNSLQPVFEAHPDLKGVMHFAAYKSVVESVALPYKYYRNNLNSLITVMELMEEFEIKNFIFSSSCTVYGVPENDIIVDESTPLKSASSPYGETKLLCEKIIEERAKNTDLSIISLRYFNPIGAHPSAQIGELPVGKPDNLIPFVTQTAVGIREELTIFGDQYNTPDGTNIRDYIHVCDVCNAHVKALEYLAQQINYGSVEVFNIGTGQGKSVLEVVKSFEKVTGVDLNYKIGPARPGDVPAIYASNKKAVEKLNWKPHFTFEESLQTAWDWQLMLKKRNFSPQTFLHQDKH